MLNKAEKMKKNQIKVNGLKHARFQILVELTLRLVNIRLSYPA